MANFRYRREKRLIVIEAAVYGKNGRTSCSFVLDTGASMTTIDPSITDLLGYSAQEAVGFSTVSSAVGKERGYRLRLAAFETLGQHIPNYEIACHDLKDKGVEGLIGMDFLERFRWCVDPQRQVIAIGE